MIEFFSGISLEDFLIYIINGFLFTGIWRFMHNQQSKGGVGDRLLTCLVVGFCLVSTYNCIPIPSRLPFVIESCVASSIIAYVAGRILNSKVVEKIFCFMKIRSTYPGGFWFDVQDKRDCSFWMEAEYQGNIYYGQVELIESHERFPLITLVYYEKRDKDGTQLEDHTHDYTQKVLIDTAKCDSIKLLYNAED